MISTQMLKCLEMLPRMLSILRMSSLPSLPSLLSLLADVQNANVSCQPHFVTLYLHNLHFYSHLELEMALHLLLQHRFLQLHLTDHHHRIFLHRPSSVQSLIHLVCLESILNTLLTNPMNILLLMMYAMPILSTPLRHLLGILKVGLGYERLLIHPPLTFLLLPILARIHMLRSQIPQFII